MAIRILFDDKETAILVDYYTQFRDGKITRIQAITDASNELRNRAIQNGIEVEDSFRSENGIAMQMSKIEDLFLGRPERLSKASQVLVDIVNKYLTDRKSFHRVLKEARGVQGDSFSVQEQFFSWLSERVSPMQLYDLYLVYPDIESFCLGRKILKEGIFSTVDIAVIAAVKNCVDSNKIFRFTYKKKIGWMQSAIKYYFDFVKTYKLEKRSEPNCAPNDERCVVVPQTEDPLIMFLEKHEVLFFDNRANGGCLWIKGEHELDNVVKYCRVNFGVSFQYKEDGTHTFDGEKGWWTRNYAELVVKRTEVLQKCIPASLDSQAFQKWMFEEQGMALTSSRSYASGINNCEQLAIRLKLSSQRIYGVLLDEAQQTMDLLMQTEEFQEANRNQHNRLRASMAKYLQYLSEGKGRTEEQQRDISYSWKPVVGAIPEINEDFVSYSQILSDRFPKGFRAESNLDLKRFMFYYNERFGTTLDVNDGLVREKIKECVLRVGVRHENYIFAVDTLVSADTKERLLDYVEKSFSQGNKILYYRAIFGEFNDEFLGQRIYDEDMLRTYLKYECGGMYVFERNYISLERDVQIDPKAELKQVLISQGSPMKCAEIYVSLSNFPEDRINRVLHTNKEFVCNTCMEYFHVSLIDLSDDELGDISGVVQQIIDERHFVSGNEMINAIHAKYPAMLERFSQFSQNGIRDSIAYYLNDRFSFNGNIISSLQRQLSMSDVFAEFAKTHSSFTLDELIVLKNEMNSTVYFEAIYENSLRVSRERFVSKDEADFDVAKTDAAIASYCTGTYLPLSGISSFGSFPYAGFPWNIYLLEHYVASYSKEFKLLHTGYNADKCVGAIVKKDSGINDFDTLITDVLAHSDISLNPEDARQYLYDMGYLARRRFSDIDQILMRARAQKG